MALRVLGVTQNMRTFMRGVEMIKVSLIPWSDYAQQDLNYVILTWL